jgi:hypothetical protein
VDAATSHDERELHARLAQARERLDGLVRDLRGVDRELDALASERTQYRLLDEACSALAELRALGADALFWGAWAADPEADEFLRRARARVDVFQKRLSEIEDRRQEIFDEIQRAQEQTDLLEDDLFDAQVQEERRKQEWVIEREVEVLPARPLVMPWTRGGEEDQRFRRSLRISLLLGLLLALLIPQIDLPLPELGEEPIEVPERLTRLLTQARPLPPPPAREETKPERRAPEESLAEEKAPPQTTKPKEGPGKGPGEGPGAGPGKGILAFREKFSGFQENQAIARLAQARISAPGAAQSGLVERSMVTTLAAGSSGGINLAELSRGVAGGGGGGGGRIAGVQIARATSTIGGGGGGGRALGSGGSGGGPPEGRTDEEIQIVFDRHKAALYRLYNRELRRDPTLKGQMILRLTIEPDGGVSLCELRATDMKAPQLAAEVVARVRTFDFGAKEGIAAVTIVYPIDFLPAT